MYDENNPLIGIDQLSEYNAEIKQYIAEHGGEGGSMPNPSAKDKLLISNEQLKWEEIDKSELGGDITSDKIVEALGYTPYDSSNPNGYTSNEGTITEIIMNGTSQGTYGTVDLGEINSIPQPTNTNKLLISDENMEWSEIDRSDIKEMPEPSESNRILISNENLEWIETDAESVGQHYTLPIATDNTLGGVKVGDGLMSEADGTLSINPSQWHLLAKVTGNEVITLPEEYDELYINIARGSTTYSCDLTIPRLAIEEGGDTVKGHRGGACNNRPNRVYIQNVTEGTLAASSLTTIHVDFDLTYNKAPKVSATITPQTSYGLDRTLIINTISNITNTGCDIQVFNNYASSTNLSANRRISLTIQDTDDDWYMSYYLKTTQSTLQLSDLYFNYISILDTAIMTVYYRANAIGNVGRSSGGEGGGMPIPSGANKVLVSDDNFNWVEKNTTGLVTAVTTSTHGTSSTRQDLLTKSFATYWDGSYSDSTHKSNLRYCYKGEFGDIITHNASEFAANSNATTSKAGLMSATDKTNLNNLASKGSVYSIAQYKMKFYKCGNIMTITFDECFRSNGEVFKPATYNENFVPPKTKLYVPSVDDPNYYIIIDTNGQITFRKPSSSVAYFNCSISYGI